MKKKRTPKKAPPLAPKPSAPPPLETVANEPMPLRGACTSISATPTVRPPASEWFHISFAGFANSLAAWLGAPVYLCGSALRRPTPGDYDIRVVVSEADMLRIFGKDNQLRRAGDGWTERQWRIAREQLKQSRRLSRAMRVNIDFQIQTVEEAATRENQPRLRLDKAPDDFFRVGLGEP